jgi:hypothetical protein
MHMSHLLTLKAVVGAVLLVCSQAVLAANLYRCGTSYQDTPCTSTGANNKAIKSNAKVANTDSSQPEKIDTNCKQRGEAAKKIMWAREVGKTLDQQLESSNDRYSQALIKDVYNHRGSSLEVRNAIEQECMQQKEQDKLADKLITEAQRLRSKGSSSLESAANNTVQPVVAPSETNVSGIKTSNSENRTKPDGNKAK